MACSSGNPVAEAVKNFFKFLGDPIGTIIGVVAKAILSAAISVFGSLTTSIPTLVTGGAANDVNAETQWVVVYVAIGSLLFASCRMALERRGDAGQVALKGLLRVVLVSGGATAVTTATAHLADRYADHLFKAGAEKQLTGIGCDTGDHIQSFLLLVLAFLLLIAGIIQTILLYIRLGVMILLLGTLPLAAVASMTNWGGGWWRKHLAWMVAWLLYKPAAGLVMYAGAAMINSSPDGGVQERIAGIGVMLLSAVSLPALLKLVVPATAALGGGGAMRQGVGAAAGAVASGAKSLGGGAMSAAKGAMGGAAGAAGSAGGSGAAGAAGPTGAKSGSGAGGGSGSGGPRPAGGPAGAAAGPAGAAAAAAGPAGMALQAAATAAKVVGGVVSGAVDGAGEQDHHHHQR
ncbi:hypothetical protein ACIQB5_48455 [Streptomyces sp. NPDC088560]|uniref:hypothetical protein n=1 Tax=Streptomyces sp. NPDC088560 TaxID=3365868 RepID=UPI00383038C6